MRIFRSTGIAPIYGLSRKDSTYFFIVLKVFVFLRLETNSVQLLNKEKKVSSLSLSKIWTRMEAQLLLKYLALAMLQMWQIWNVSK